MYHVVLYVDLQKTTSNIPWLEMKLLVFFNKTAIRIHNKFTNSELKLLAAYSIMSNGVMYIYPYIIYQSTTDYAVAT